jgi:hypothetical protein
VSGAVGQLVPDVAFEVGNVREKAAGERLDELERPPVVDRTRWEEVVTKLVRPFFVTGFAQLGFGVVHPVHRVSEAVVKLEELAVRAVNVLDTELQLVKRVLLGFAEIEFVGMGLHCRTRNDRVKNVCRSGNGCRKPGRDLDYGVPSPGLTIVSVAGIVRMLTSPQISPVWLAPSRCSRQSRSAVSYSMLGSERIVDS